MRRSLLPLLGLLATLGCGKAERERTAFVEVTSSPSGILMSVSVGFTDPVTFEAETPIARNVRSKVFCGTGVRTASGACLEVATARVQGGNPAGIHVTMCLTDAGEQDCATGNDGQVSVRMTVRPE